MKTEIFLGDLISSFNLPKGLGLTHSITGDVISNGDRKQFNIAVA